MKIKTITCHNVYNLGASLQAYALAAYLQSQGHEVEIIDYQPLYLRHYRLAGVPNPRFDKPFLREAYQIAKFPGRLYDRLTSKRKKAFDRFTAQYLPVTQTKYSDLASLRAAPPEADLYIAGSDQIWNPLFQNGKDPAFFLDFVPEGKRRISYAASFAAEEMSEASAKLMSPWLKKLDAISVREKSGLELLGCMGLNGIWVVDPVFLLNIDCWRKLAIPIPAGLFVYDFDNSPKVQEIAHRLANRENIKIVSAFPWAGAQEVFPDMGPQEFLGAIWNAKLVLSNSFHATAFALIFHKNFFVVERQEKINARMKDLLASVGLEDRLIDSAEMALQAAPIDWSDVDKRLESRIFRSKKYLQDQVSWMK